MLRTTSIITYLLGVIPALAANAIDDAPSSSPANLVPHNHKVFFSCDDGIHGLEPWLTDGTSEGTGLLLDIVQGEKGCEKIFWSTFATNGNLIFAAKRNVSLMGVYATDGTQEGTVRLREWTTQQHGFVQFIGETNGHVLFHPHVVDLSGLWHTDGTPNGTAQIFEHPLFSELGNTLAVDDGVLFADVTNNAIFFSDATRQNTRLISHMSSGIQFAMFEKAPLFITQNHNSDPARIWRLPLGGKPEIAKEFKESPTASVNMVAPLRDKFIFTFEDSATGDELWDWNNGNPKLLLDINPGVSGSNPHNFYRFRNGVFFRATTVDQGTELWFTDGTAQGTRIVQDIVVGQGSSTPYAMAILDDKLAVFSAHGQSGEELWATDGDSCWEVLDINPRGDSVPYFTVAMNGRAYFAATSPEAGEELWTSDGTRQGTYMVKDINQVRVVNPGSNPGSLTSVGNNLFFVVNDLEHGAELWLSDGTADGTRLVRDILPGPASSNPQNLHAHEGKLYFAADNGVHGIELWSSEGSEQGTGMIADLAKGTVPSSPREFTSAGPTLFLVAFADEVQGNAIFWLLPGGFPNLCHGTNNFPPSWNPKHLRAAGDWLYFVADDGIHGEELWRTNKSETEIVRDILEKPQTGSYPDSVISNPPGVYFTADDGKNGRELWRAADTGVTLVRDLSLHLP